MTAMLMILLASASLAAIVYVLMSPLTQGDDDFMYGSRIMEPFSITKNIGNTIEDAISYMFSEREREMIDILDENRKMAVASRVMFVVIAIGLIWFFSGSLLIGSIAGIPAGIIISKVAISYTMKSYIQNTEFGMIDLIDNAPILLSTGTTAKQLPGELLYNKYVSGPVERELTMTVNEMTRGSLPEAAFDRMSMRLKDSTYIPSFIQRIKYIFSYAEDPGVFSGLAHTIEELRQKRNAARVELLGILLLVAQFLNIFAVFILIVAAVIGPLLASGGFTFN